MTQASKPMAKANKWEPLDNLKREDFQRYERRCDKSTLVSIQKMDVGWSIYFSAAIHIDGITNIEDAKQGADSILRFLGYELE